MSGSINLHVGSVEDMGKRFIGAWHKLEQGNALDETHLTFLDLETMVSTLSPKRLALLRHVRQHPAENIPVLAKSLGRDYKRVHDAWFTPACSNATRKASAPHTTACIPRFRCM
ncbi:MAG: hypothetical protein Q8N33_08130 [Rhodocyclaceae bacterium]|nr:hypothetical protein [Rhodocyclaceae bacterium]